MPLMLHVPMLIIFKMPQGRASVIICILQSSFEKLHNLFKFTQLVRRRAGI